MSLSRTQCLGISLGLFSAARLSAALVAYYPLTENVLDGSGNNNHGIFQGVGGANPLATFIEDELFGSVMDFDGTDDRIILGPMFTMLDSSWSISMWIRTGSNPDRVPLWGKNDARGGFNAGERNIEITGSGTWANLIDPEPPGNLAVNGHSMGGQTTNQSAIQLDDGNWHHIVVSHDDSISDTHHPFWIDGQIQSVGAQLMNNNDRPDVGDMYLGYANASGTGAEGFFVGQMAHVSIYNSAIDQNEVNALFRIPEPSVLCLLGLASCAAAHRRRRARPPGPPAG